MFRVLRCVPILFDEDGMGRWPKPVQNTFFSAVSAINSLMELVAFCGVIMFMFSLAFMVVFKGDYDVAVYHDFNTSAVLSAAAAANYSQASAAPTPWHW